MVTKSHHLTIDTQCLFTTSGTAGLASKTRSDPDRSSPASHRQEQPLEKSHKSSQHPPRSRSPSPYRASTHGRSQSRDEGHNSQKLSQQQPYYKVSPNALTQKLAVLESAQQEASEIVRVQHLKKLNPELLKDIQMLEQHHGRANLRHSRYDYDAI